MINQIVKYTSLIIITLLTIVSFILITTQWEGVVRFLFGN